jgi:hypothetical protein
LDEVFLKCRIVKVEESVISRAEGEDITLIEILIIPHITKPNSIILLLNLSGKDKLSH